ncbi:MAG: hypothetical protein WA631_13950, partial [Nitrososphaeraceae archaeon]
MKSENKQLFVVVIISIVVISGILPLNNYELAIAKSKKKSSENSGSLGASSSDVTNENNVSAQQPNPGESNPQQSSNLGGEQSSSQIPSTRANSTAPEQQSSSENVASGPSPTFVPQQPSSSENTGQPSSSENNTSGPSPTFVPQQPSSS